jgi:hypothetical protein
MYLFREGPFRTSCDTVLVAEDAPECASGMGEEYGCYPTSHTHTLDTATALPSVATLHASVSDLPRLGGAFTWGPVLGIVTPWPSLPLRP